MKALNFLGLSALSLIWLITLGCSNDRAHEDGHGHAGGHAAEEAEYERGPHRGRMLRDGDFAVEITIFESGVPPEFRVYPYRDGEPLDPGSVDLSIELSRLGGQVDRFPFRAEGDVLRGEGVVAEPHSFDVKVTATEAGNEHVWAYESYEGRTTIAPEQAESAGIKTAVAGPGLIRDTVTLYGSIQPNAERLRQVKARFSGVIQSVEKQVGDSVKAGERLARIESNESLQSYSVTSPLAGTVIERHANAGEVAGDKALFAVADYSSLWVDLTVFPRDRARIKVGQPVAVTSVDGEQSAQAQIAVITPSSEPGSQNLIARLTLQNPEGLWTPGLFVTGEVTVAEHEAELVVPVSAIQAFRDFQVVYARVGNTYEVRMLDLGRSDGERVEVQGGLDPGTEYVTENSFLIKADIEKSGATHDH